MAPLSAHQKSHDPPPYSTGPPPVEIMNGPLIQQSYEPWAFPSDLSILVTVKKKKKKKGVSFAPDLHEGTLPSAEGSCPLDPWGCPPRDVIIIVVAAVMMLEPFDLGWYNSTRIIQFGNTLSFVTFDMILCFKYIQILIYYFVYFFTHSESFVKRIKSHPIKTYLNSVLFKIMGNSIENKELYTKFGDEIILETSLVRSINYLIQVKFTGVFCRQLASLYISYCEFTDKMPYIFISTQIRLVSQVQARLVCSGIWKVRDPRW